MIYLNGVYFTVVALSQKPSIEMFSTGRRATTGRLVMTQSQIVSNERTFTLNVDASERLRLETLLTVLGPMDFIDDDGFQWLIASGSDTSNIAYGTGAYFKERTKLNYILQKGPDERPCDTNWNVDITLAVNAIDVRSGGSVISDTSGLLIMDDSGVDGT